MLSCAAASPGLLPRADDLCVPSHAPLQVVIRLRSPTNARKQAERDHRRREERQRRREQRLHGSAAGAEGWNHLLLEHTPASLPGFDPRPAARGFKVVAEDADWWSRQMTRMRSRNARRGGRMTSGGGRMAADDVSLAEVRAEW